MAAIATADGVSFFLALLLLLGGDGLFLLHTDCSLDPDTDDRDADTCVDVEKSLGLPATATFAAAAAAAADTLSSLLIIHAGYFC